MHELNKRDYPKIQPIFKDIDHGRPAIYTLIEGNTNHGRVFVDSIDKPSSAFIEYGGFSVGGDENNDMFNRELKEIITTQIMPSREGMIIHGFSDEWKNILDELLKDYSVQRIIRYIFVDVNKELFFERHSGWKEKIPEGYYIKRMDSELAEKEGVTGVFDSIDDFLQRGFGFCVMEDDEIISCCDTVFVGDGRAATSIRTNKQKSSRIHAWR